MPPSKSLAIYSFGYWGWGTVTKQLVRIMDTAEIARGNVPPFFVDVRIRRTGRAPGFKEDTFESLVGSDRYHWEHRLGNIAIVTGAERMKIAKPAAAADLLNRAIELAKRKQPVVFFCACEWPRRCHRHIVGNLILKEAKRRGKKVRVVEWPGGEPILQTVKVSEDDYKKIEKGRKSIVITENRAKELAGLPWCTIAEIHAKGKESLYAVTGPPKYEKEGWYLPLPWNKKSTGLTLDKVRHLARTALRKNGFEPHEA